MKKKIYVEIEETLKKVIEVEAESYEEALEKVESAYYDGDYVLDAEDFTETNFYEVEKPYNNKYEVFEEKEED